MIVIMILRVIYNNKNIGPLLPKKRAAQVKAD